jgi:hypothetical protein
MPIDEALELLEGVPEYLLKTKKLIPRTIEELAEMYKHKFNIEENNNNFDIKFLDEHTDIDGDGSYILVYTIYLKDEKQINKSIRDTVLYDINGSTWQQIENTCNDHFNAQWVRGTYTENILDRGALEEWFNKTEEFILKEIPELEEFVKNYAN